LKPEKRYSQSLQQKVGDKSYKNLADFLQTCQLDPKSNKIKRDLIEAENIIERLERTHALKRANQFLEKVKNMKSKESSPLPKKIVKIEVEGSEEENTERRSQIGLNERNMMLLKTRKPSKKELRQMEKEGKLGVKKDK